MPDPRYFKPTGEIRRGDLWRSLDPKDRGVVLKVISIIRIEKMFRRRMRLQPSSILTLQNTDTKRVTQVRLDEITKRFKKLVAGPPGHRVRAKLP